MRRILLAIALSAFITGIFSADVLAWEGSEGWYEEGCETASVSCSASYTSTLYINGLTLGQCLPAPTIWISVTTRPYFTNTFVLYSDSSITYDLSATCQATMTTEPDVVTSTAVLPAAPGPDMSPSSVLDGGGFLGIAFGGSLSNPWSPINTWLGIAEDFVDVVNTGNILYIIGAVAGASAVLSWAINKVKNPGM